MLINNAGIATRNDTAEAARDIFATNYYGIKMVNKHLFPLIRENGRVVNVSSITAAWALHDMADDIQKKFKSATLTEEELDGLVRDFISASATKRTDKFVPNAKLPGLSYPGSKTALTALTRIQARQWSGAKNVLLLAVCPGYCSTDLNNHGPGSRPAALGADSILHVVNTPRVDLENGEFYQDGKKLPQSSECTMDYSAFRQHLEKKA